MLEDLTTGAVAGGVLALLIQYGRLRRTNSLDGKLRELAGIATTAGLFLLLFVIGVAAQGRPELLPRPGDDADGLPAWAQLVAETVRAREARLTWYAIAPAGLLLAFAPSLVHVLRELAPFVLHHRLDLAARDKTAGA